MADETKCPKLFDRKRDMILADRSDPSVWENKCELCGEYRELRPYGPNGENVCFTCGMKDEEAAKKQFLSRMNIQ